MAEIREIAKVSTIKVSSRINQCNTFKLKKSQDKQDYSYITCNCKLQTVIETKCQHDNALRCCI